MPVQKITLIEPVKHRLNPEQKLKSRWLLMLFAVMVFSVLSYFLLPLWLGDDIYLAILIPHFQWLLLGLLSLSVLLGARLYLFNGDRRPPNPSFCASADSVLNNPNERLKKFSIATLSQFLAPQTWSIELLQKLSPRQFTQLCLSYYEMKAIPHSTHQLGLSSGLNILIWQNDIVSKVIRISNDHIVEMNSLRQFLGVLVHERAHAGVYIHRGTFSEEVRIFAASHNIQLRNEYACLAKIVKLSERRQQRLLKQILN